MSELQSEKTGLLMLTGTNWAKWSAIMKIHFKMKKAWELIDNNKKASDFENDQVKKEQYEELALVVHLALLKSTDGEDNELVRAQEPEDISAAWNKLVAKHEGEKDDILLRTFDDLILESLTDLKGTDIYVERYMRWAKQIKENTKKIDDLVKLIIVTNMLRDLPKEFDSTKERVREKLKDYELKDVGEALKTRGRELVKEERYQEQFKGLKEHTSAEYEIERMNAQVNQIGFRSDYRQPNYGYRGSYNFGNSNYKGKPWNYIENYRPWERESQRRWLNNVDCEDGERRGSEAEPARSENESRVVEQKPKKFVGSLNTIGQNLKPKKIVGHLASITGRKVVNESRGNEQSNQKPKMSSDLDRKSANNTKGDGKVELKPPEPNRERNKAKENVLKIETRLSQAKEEPEQADEMNREREIESGADEKQSEEQPERQGARIEDDRKLLEEINKLDNHQKAALLMLVKGEQNKDGLRDKARFSNLKKIKKRHAKAVTIIVIR